MNIYTIYTTFDGILGSILVGILPKGFAIWSLSSSSPGQGGCWVKGSREKGSRNKREIDRTIAERKKKDK